MARYVICKGCGNLIEYKPVTKYEGGTSYITFEYPLFIMGLMASDETIY